GAGRKVCVQRGSARFVKNLTRGERYRYRTQRREPVGFQKSQELIGRRLRHELIITRAWLSLQAQQESAPLPITSRVFQTFSNIRRPLLRFATRRTVSKGQRVCTGM